MVNLKTANRFLIVLVFFAVLMVGGGGVWYFSQNLNHNPDAGPTGINPDKQLVDDQVSIRKTIKDFYDAYGAKDGKLLMSYFTPPITDPEKESYGWLVGDDIGGDDLDYRIFLRVDISNPTINKIEKTGEGDYKVTVDDEFKGHSNVTASWSQPQKRSVYFILEKIGDKWQIDQYVLDGYVKRPKYSGFGQEPIEYPGQEGSAAQEIYRITLSEIKPADRGSLFLKDYLDESFGLPQYAISNIAFDTREGKPLDIVVYNHPYYILVNGGNELKNEYKNKDISIRVEKADKNLIPYLQNPDYCESDTDCVIRNNFCSYGAFNYYHGFLDVWGCENTYYPEENEADLQKACDKKTQHAEANYTNAKCIDRRCEAQGGTIKCVGGVPI